MIPSQHAVRARRLMDAMLLATEAVMDSREACARAWETRSRAETAKARSGDLRVLIRAGRETRAETGVRARVLNAPSGAGAAVREP